MSVQKIEVIFCSNNKFWSLFKIDFDCLKHRAVEIVIEDLKQIWEVYINKINKQISLQVSVRDVREAEIRERHCNHKR